MDIIVKDQIYYLEVLVTDANGKGEAGLNVGYEIFRSDNDDSIDLGSLIDVGGGVYKKDIRFSDLSQHIGQYRILYTFDNSKIVVDELGNIVVDEIGNIVVLEGYADVLPGGYPDTIQGVMVIEEAIDVTVQAIKDGVDFIKDIEGGRWKLDKEKNQMIFYKDDNITPVANFNLFDEAGNPSIENVFERKRKFN